MTLEHIFKWLVAWLVACLTVKQHKDGSSPRVFFFIRTTVWPPALTSSTVAGVCQRGGVRCGNRSLSQQHHCDRGHRAGHHRRPGPWCRSGSGRDVPAEEEENRWVLKNPALTQVEGTGTAVQWFVWTPHHCTFRLCPYSHHREPPVHIVVPESHVLRQGVVTNRWLSTRYDTRGR